MLPLFAVYLRIHQYPLNSCLSLLSEVQLDVPLGATVLRTKVTLIPHLALLVAAYRIQAEPAG